MREIKFRAWSKDKKQMLSWPELMRDKMLVYSFFGNESWMTNPPKPMWERMQFTGFLDKNNKEIFEGDIFRVEEDRRNTGLLNGIQDDLIYYLVIVWIKEWGMFGTLRASDEYPAYLQDGADALDEPMFWTYTLEDTDSQKFFLCGNIYQNANLLKL